ncbi:AsmA family protein [Roseomonas sp. CAU 1739]|uniref:AsmA family protein n=1 Tax=Roseomonas sp. CAU 1739 TaxID=3140364 RepID=UPI00325B743F
MRALKWAAGLLAGLLLLAIGGIVAATYALDAGALTPRLVAAIEAATGRAATLGRVSVGLGLTPRVTIEDATLANIPGGTRPDMARIRHASANIALLPLLRGDIAFRSIAIDGADILLERAPDGTPNWVLQPPPREPAPATATPASPPAPERQRRRIAIGVVTLADSRVTLPDRRLGVVTVEMARLQGLGEGQVDSFTARVGAQGVTLALIGEAPAAPAPIRATLAAGANRLVARGRPGQGFALDAAMPDYAALRPLLAALAPAAPLPATLPALTATLRLDDDLRPLGGTLHAAAADLAVIRPGLALTRLDLAAPALDQPAEVTVEGSQAGLAFTARLTLDQAGALLPAAADVPLAVTLQAEAAGARVEASGRILRPRMLEGASFDIRAAVPDMLALAAILPDPLPLRDATFAARLVAEGPLRGPLRIETLRIAAPALAAQGELHLTPGQPFGIEGRLLADRIDLDALARRVPGATDAPPTPAAPQAAPAESASPAPVPPPEPARPPAPAASPEPAAAPAAAANDRRVIPDIALPLAGLATWHGRIDLRATQARIDGMDWRDLHAVIAQEDEVLHIAPLTVTSPGGAVQGEIRIDRRADPPAVALILRSTGPGLDLAALRRARDEAPSVEGHAQIAIDVTARGATTRALAASLSGEAGFAMVDGRAVSAGLTRLGPDILALLLPGAPRDRLALRCLALRVGAEDGIATTSALFAETGAGQVSGMAAVNLRTERLAARLLPDVQVLGVTVRAPVGIGGSLSAPRIGVEPGRALTQVVGDTVANRLWRSPTVEWLRGQVPGQYPAGGCEDQLRLARMGADGPMPAPQAVVPGVPRELQGTAQDLLRGLLGGRRR